MKKLDRYEREILGAYEKGTLISARPTRAPLGAFRDAARATFIKSRRVNLRLSAADLMDNTVLSSRWCALARRSPTG